MIGLHEIVIVSTLGLLTTSSSTVGAALGSHVRLSSACRLRLAFAAGALISALAIELVFEGAARNCIDRVSTRTRRTGLIGCGFALGYRHPTTSLPCSSTRRARRDATRHDFEYALGQKQKDAKEKIQLLSKCDSAAPFAARRGRTNPALVCTRHDDGGEILFDAGDAGDALYIVARGKVDVWSGTAAENDNGHVAGENLAELGEGRAFGEMALLSGEPRTATIRSAAQTDLLEMAGKI